MYEKPVKTGEYRQYGPKWGKLAFFHTVFYPYTIKSIAAFVRDGPSPHTVPSEEVQTGPEVPREERLPRDDAGKNIC